MLRVERLTKIFDNATDQIVGGIRDASFELETGTFFTLLGPSGCGKTTTLRCIAGLETPDDGVIAVDDRALFDAQGAHQRAGRAARHRHGVPVLCDLAAHDGGRERRVPAHRRQAPPHSARRDRGGGASARSRSSISTASRSAPRPGCPAASSSAWRSRAPSCTSRGLLLLDEPLSNLDAQLRDEMRGELKRLQSKIGITTVYVTHDQSEALALSDRIAVIDRGRIMQIGSPQDIYFRPANPFVARFVGATNLLAGPPASAPPTAAAQVEVLSGRADPMRRCRRRSTIRPRYRSRSGRKASS